MGRQRCRPFSLSHARHRPTTMLKDYFQWEVRSLVAGIIRFGTVRCKPCHRNGRHGIGHRRTRGWPEPDGWPQQGSTSSARDLNGPIPNGTEHCTGRSAGTRPSPTKPSMLRPLPIRMRVLRCGRLQKRDRCIGDQGEDRHWRSREMHRVLKPGGVLLFAENLHGTALHAGCASDSLRGMRTGATSTRLPTATSSHHSPQLELHATGLHGQPRPQ